MRYVSRTSEARVGDLGRTKALGNADGSISIESKGPTTEGKDRTEGSPFAGGPGSREASRLDAKHDAYGGAGLPDTARNTRVSDSKQDYRDLAALKAANQNARSDLSANLERLPQSSSKFAATTSAQLRDFAQAQEEIGNKIIQSMSAAIAVPNTNPGGASASSPYPFATDPSTPHGERLFGAWQFRNFVHKRVILETHPERNQHLQLVETADMMLAAADYQFQDALIEAGEALVHKSLVMLDMAIGMVPGNGEALALMAMGTGINQITKEKLTDMDYVFLTTGLVVSAAAYAYLGPAGVVIKPIVFAGAKAIAHFSGPAVLQTVKILQATVASGKLGKKKAAELLERFVGAEKKLGPSGKSPSDENLGQEIARLFEGKSDGIVLHADGTYRVSYASDLKRDLSTKFEPGYLPKEGPLADDLVLVQYHRDNDVNKRSLAWWTTTEQANEIRTIEDARRVLALPPDWGPRNVVTVARIPKGTNISAYFGKASPQESVLLGTTYPGGGAQHRFKDFSASWLEFSWRIE